MEPSGDPDAVGLMSPQGVTVIPPAVKPEEQSVKERKTLKTLEDITMFVHPAASVRLNLKSVFDFTVNIFYSKIYGQTNFIIITSTNLWWICFVINNG